MKTSDVAVLVQQFIDANSRDKLILAMIADKRITGRLHHTSENTTVARILSQRYEYMELNKADKVLIAIDCNVEELPIFCRERGTRRIVLCRCTGEPLAARNAKDGPIPVQTVRTALRASIR